MSSLFQKKLTVPPFIKSGDTIGIVTPASPYQAKVFQEGLHLLKQWGFQVALGRKRILRKGYLAGTDRERAEELMRLFADPEIKAILCSRGGYGALRILDYLDFNLIKTHPKLFMGFSDVTVLLLAFWKKTHLMTFHGPMVTTLSQLNPAFLNKVQAVLKGHYQIKIPLSLRRAISPGSAQGKLIGGNLSLLIHLIGTPYEPDWDQSILFLEDCGEEAYRLDRLMTHLRLSGCLGKVSAILLGEFKRPDRKGQSRGLFRDILGDLGIPVWSGLPIGHGSRNFPLPIGAPATLDAEKGLWSIHI